MTSPDESKTHRLIATRKEFHAALHEVLGEAASQGCRELLICDADFADWPLGERAVIELLTQWAGAKRRFTMLAQHYDAVVARHSRFVQWRRTWSHLIDCRSLEELDADDWPTVLLARDLACVRLLNRVHLRGVVSHDSADLLLAAESIDAVLQRSAEAFPATTLGI